MFSLLGEEKGLALASLDIEHKIISNPSKSHFAPRIFDSRQLPKPSNSLPESLCAKDFYLEIGAGNGRHALAWAQSNPSEVMVAIERTKGKSAKACRRIGQNESKPSNLYYFQDDAVNWVTHNVISNNIKGVFILYPNPYPKECQKNKRFHFMPFMTLLSRRMKVGAPLILATNDPKYFSDACEILPRCHSLELTKQRVMSPFSEPRTNFEELFFQRGILCYEACFTKIE